MAIVSILHRLSGLLLACLIPVILLGLSVSLRSSASFEHLQQCLSAPWSKFLIWFFWASLMYHLLAGIRHMIMDFGFGESVSTARKSSWFLFALVAVVNIALGVWLW
tara:strand:- start:100 stop:420 length:321 start_codon:yes stop_codon:yes gene_type:complete